MARFLGSVMACNLVNANTNRVKDSKHGWKVIFMGGHRLQRIVDVAK